MVIWWEGGGDIMWEREKEREREREGMIMVKMEHSLG